MNKKNIENPLTIKKLREMVGMPVLVQCLNPGKYVSPPAGWRILEKSITGHFGVRDGDNCLTERDYGTEWLAYAYPPARVDREAWEPCLFCCEERKWRRPLAFDEAGDAVTIEIDGNAAAIESDSMGFIIKFCPECGRPLTNKAWDELEKRIGGAK